MTLTDIEFRQYLKTHLDLLFFVGQKKKIVRSNINLKAFLNLDLSVKFKCREAVYKNEYLLDEYIASNFDNLTTEQIKIINSFKKKIKTDFIILKCLKKYAVFINTNDNKFYTVKGLSDPFDAFFSKFPTYITTAIIPFKDKIIYDGFFQSSNLYLGPNMTRRMNEEYKIAKQNNEIISSLD